MGEPQVLAKVERGKLRDHHHRIAFLIATGKRTGEVANITGMSIQRISNLRHDEVFNKLVEVYRNKAMTVEWDVYKKSMSTRETILSLTLEEMRDRLEECPELFSVRDLLEIQADMADRLGQGKINRSESYSVTRNLDLADSLAEARRRELRLSASLPAPEGDAAAGRVTPSQETRPDPERKNGKVDQ